MDMKVLVLGGTGFIGYHAVREFYKRGYEITVISRPPVPAQGLFPEDVKVRLTGLEDLKDGRAVKLMGGQDAVVFAGGADDRIIPKRPAYPFFRKKNVEDCIRFFKLARQAKVKRGVFLGSYFCHFQRQWPELRLSHHHPYIRSRVEQEELVLGLSDDKMEISCLELPYIFGSMPGRVPLWAPLVNYLRSSYPLLYPTGGTNCVSVGAVGESVVAAVENGVGGQAYLIGDRNLTWTKLLEKLMKYTEKRKKVRTVPTPLLFAAAPFIDIRYKLKGKEGGLSPFQYIKVQTSRTYFDPKPAQKELGFKATGLDRAIKDTVKASPKR